MKDKGKAVAVSSSSNWFSDYYSSSELPCKKHPFSSSVGICAYCLKDRLIKLVCSDCGEQRLSSCSCSDISTSYPNSSTVDIGSVGRISFLIENDKDGFRHSHSHSSIKSQSQIRAEATALLKRSSSTSNAVDVKRGGFWKFGRLFRKKRGVIGNNVDGVDEKSEMWDFQNMGVSRSRSVCGFRGGFDDSDSNITLSTGRPSVLQKDEHADSEKKSRAKIGKLFQTQDVFGGVNRDGPSVMSESNSKSARKGGLIEFDGSFSVGEDPGFIDLNLGLSSESKPEFSCLKNDNFLQSVSSFRISRDGVFSGPESHSFDHLRDGMLSNGRSCRITVNNNEIKKCKKSFKVWKWIVKHHSSTAGRPSWQKDEHDSKI